MKKEIQKLKWLGYTDQAIIRITGLSEGIVKRVIREVRKESNTYNDDHRMEKYEANEDFFYEVSPRSILDLFAGQKRYWFTMFSETVKVVDNDIEFPAVYRNNAWELIDEISGKSFDLIDIDPFNSPAGLIRKSIKMARKGLIVTFGDVKQVHRFNKDRDYFRENYDIDKDPKDIGISDIRDRIIEIGKEEGKNLTLFVEFNWRTVMRFYFKIEA